MNDHLEASFFCWQGQSRNTGAERGAAQLWMERLRHYLHTMHLPLGKARIEIRLMTLLSWKNHDFLVSRSLSFFCSGLENCWSNSLKMCGSHQSRMWHGGKNRDMKTFFFSTTTKESSMISRCDDKCITCKCTYNICFRFS